MKLAISMTDLGGQGIHI